MTLLVHSCYNEMSSLAQLLLCAASTLSNTDAFRLRFLSSREKLVDKSVQQSA